MTQVTLPRLNQVGSNEWGDVESNDTALRDVINGKLENDNLSGAAAITRANLAAEAKPFKWYTPKIVATEESRESAILGTMPTPDEVKEVVLPENALMLILYTAYWRTKSSGEGGGSGTAAIFLGANRLKIPDGESGEPIDEGAEKPAGNPYGGYWKALTTHGGGLVSGANITVATAPSRVSTGEVVGFDLSGDPDTGGPVYVRAAAGTYNVSVRFSASTGPVRAKSRHLWVGVLGATA